MQLFLKEHEGATLKHAMGEVQKFIDADKTAHLRFCLAGGNAGVGVDYGIYIYESLQHELEHNGKTLREAFYEALRQCGTTSGIDSVKH